MRHDKDRPRVLVDVWNAILDDSWMNIVVWGKPRYGKTTVQMKIALDVYQDEDKVLESFVYDLAGILYKMEHGIPCRIMTRNKLHDRVPILMPDDLGAGGNKAKTQHEPAWDIFKGAIDTYGTKIAVFLSSMGTPDSITSQLQSKYTHEIYVDRRGHAKYDEVDWEQNFHGWMPRRKKDWQDQFEFDPVPMSMYKRYDDQRLELVDLLNQLIKDRMADSDAIRIINRMDEDDKDLLRIISQKGMLVRNWFQEEDHKPYQHVLKRCKARSLVIPIRKGTNYYYDLTDFGQTVLATIQNAKIE